MARSGRQRRSAGAPRSTRLDCRAVAARPRRRDLGPRPAARGRSGSRRIEVNGTRISRKTSIETRNPANRNRTPRNLPSWNQLGHPEPVERVAERRDEGPDGDEDRRRDAAVEPAREQRPDRAGQRRDEVDGDRDRRDEQVEQELVARLVRVERVGEDPSLRHEHVGREDRAEDQREGPGDVEERRQQPELRREERRDRGAGRRVDARSRAPARVVVAIRTRLSDASRRRRPRPPGSASGRSRSRSRPRPRGPAARRR